MHTPIPLVAFERYMLVDDSPQHPMSFTIRLKFSGTFDPAAFSSAVQAAVRRHPFLASHVRGSGRSLFWVPADDPTPYLDIADETTPLRFPGSERIDLSSCTGLRIWVRHGLTQTQMRLQFHHSCCDGVGAYRFIEDLLCAYDLALHPDSQQTSFRPLDPSLLQRRTRFGLSWWKRWLRLPQDLCGVAAGLAILLLRQPGESYSPQRPEDRDPLLLLDYPAHTFEEAEFAALRALAREHGATLNDLLLRELMLALHTWNGRFDPQHPGQSLRIMIPINLRSGSDDLMPAANAVGMVFVERPLSWCQDAVRLLKSIRRQMKIFKVLRGGIFFIRSLQLLELIPRGMEKMQRTDWCYATSVLSNMGKLFTEARLPRRNTHLIAGGLSLDEIHSAPPVRPHSVTSFTSLSYGGKLTLVMNYDRHHFTPETANELMATVVDQIRQSIASYGKGTTTEVLAGGAS